VLPFSCMIVYIGIDFVALSFAQNEASSNPGGLEYRFLVKSLLPISFVFLALVAISEAYKDIQSLRDDTKGDELKDYNGAIEL